MDTKSKQRPVRVPRNDVQYVTEEGERLAIPVLPGNVPRFVGSHSGKDEAFLGVNKGQLYKLQQKMA